MKIKSNPWIVTGLILIALLIASFVGVSAYKTKTDHIVELAESNFKKFEVIFEELVKSRYRAMGLGADVLLAHAKDHDATGRVVAPGDGIIDLPTFVAGLRQAGYTGPLIGHGFDPALAPQAARVLQDLCQK